MPILYPPAPIGTILDNTSVFTPSGLIATSGSFTPVSQTLYAIYLGLTTTNRSYASIRFWMSTQASSVTAAEAGLLSSPVAPNEADQTLTCLDQVSISGIITSTGSKTATLTAASIPADTHLWAAIRINASTPGVVSGAVASDLTCGSTLRLTSASALSISSTYAMVLVADTIPSINTGPYLVAFG